MTAEQIKQKAKEWIRNQTYTEEDRQKGAIEVVPTKMACFIGGYTEATKELQEQIEKMKNCNNCKHKNYNWSFQPICTVRKNDDRDIENPITCKCDKWELAEN